MTHHKIDRTLAHIQSKLPFSVLNPTNIRSEEKKVFKNEDYNPQFHYKSLQRNLRPLQEILKKTRIPKTHLGKLLHEKRVELFHQICLLRSIGAKDFTRFSLAIYSKPSRELVRKALRYLNIKPEENGDFKLGKTSIVKKFLDACAHHRFSCDVIEKDMVAKAAVNAPKRRVYFSSNHSFTESDLQRLTVHEIGTHIRRGEQARKQKLKLFSLGFQGYLPTEEGLAVYNEEQAGLLTPLVLKQYAARVVAVDLSLKNTFSVVYTALKEHFTPEQAFNITLRAKRGLKNTQLPGGYTKDYVYMQGWLQVKNFVQKGGDIKELYIGKIGVHHVPYLKHIRQEIGK